MTLQRVVIGLGLCLGIATTSAMGQDLKPRVPTKRTPSDQLAVPDQPTGNLTIKFTDACLVRENGGILNSLSNANLNPVLALARDYDLTFRKAINKTDDALLALQQRAAMTSGYAQPDLAGMMTVEVPGQHLLDAARALNSLTEHVEWVRIDYVPKLPGYNMFGGDPDCGELGTGDCFDEENGTAFCEDTACCELICEFDPFCCDIDNGGVWDGFCVAAANLFCSAGDVCASGLNESCFAPHSTGGCVNEDCCNTVCDIDSFCCDANWDEGCVDLAINECLTDIGSGPTPDWTDLQGYKSTIAYTDLPGGAPGELSAPAPNLFGFGGEGWDVQGFEDFCQNLFDTYGMDASGEGVVVKGENQKVAVIEWAFYKGHEDLDVRIEPGQTLIIEPDITEPDHATACLGILNAQDNGFGMTGLVPEAEAWFFPLTSVEEGARELTAWTSYLETLGWGDVVSCSYGPGPPIGNLNNDTAIATLIALARDLGICVCVAAGNDCYNVDDAPDTWDDDIRSAPGTVVGAGSPGLPYYRLPFSNHYTDGDDAAFRSNVVHIQAWGMSTAATGYGDVFFPNGRKKRAYTSGFSGTSSACPQVAGLILMFQGLVKQVHGVPAEPVAARNNVATGRAQGGGLPRFTGGFDPDTGCSFDSDPDEGPNAIGPYCVLVGGFGSAASGYLNNGPSSGSEYLHAIYPVEGTIINAVEGAWNFMVQTQDDNWFLQIQSQPGGYDGGGSVPGGAPPEIGDVIGGTRLWGYGDVSQFLVHYRTELPEVQTMTMFSNNRVDVIGLHVIEAWNFAGARYDFIAFTGNSGLNNGTWFETTADALFPQDNWRQLAGDNGFLSCFHLDTYISFGFDQGGLEPGHIRDLDHVRVEIGPIP